MATNLTQDRRGRSNIDCRSGRPTQWATRREFVYFCASCDGIASFRTLDPSGVFSTCIHCARDLGKNEAFETFPVGKRLAFDAARGRLWVVCPSCARWNLSPLDARWETIENAEQRFRGTKLRVSTDNIGMARLREGVDLIRIGDPQRPEMAIWRYADQFGKRRVRNALIAGGAAAGLLVVGGSLVTASIAGIWTIGTIYSNRWLLDTAINGKQTAVVARIGYPNGRVLEVERRHARMSTIERFQQHNAFALNLQSRVGADLLLGDDAMRVAARLLPLINRFGGTRDDVRDAVTLFEEVGSSLDVLRSVQTRAGAWVGAPRWHAKAPSAEVLGYETHYPGALSTLQPRYRLALEMALHEESERRAMDGELAALEAQWREAEEIAHIADALVVLPSVEARLEKLRGGSAAP